MDKVADKKKSASTHTEKHRANVWASLSVTAFVVVFVLAVSLGAPLVMPFIYAGTTFFAILLLEASLRGRIWPFEEHFQKNLGQEDVAKRLLIFCASILLLMETAYIVTWITK
ncbi:MAG: hypothetical protein RDU25_02995 [Patescibacteria group bacterium]|nr:hypothetical protein [Patescibacteria group bacterium]